MKPSELQTLFYKETGKECIDINGMFIDDYVSWLQDRLVINKEVDLEQNKKENMKIIVNSEELKQQLLEQSKYIHDFLINKDDIKGLGKDWLIGLDSEKAGMLMHLYMAPQIIEVKKKDNFKDDMVKRLEDFKKKIQKRREKEK